MGIRRAHSGQATGSLPGLVPTGPQVRIVAGTTDPIYTPLYCFVEKLSSGGSLAFKVLFQGFRECEAFTVAPSGAIHLAMRAPYSFGGFAQLRTITGDDGSYSAQNLTISSLNGSLDTIPGRPFVVKDMKGDSSGSVFVLYQQLVQADSALQSRLIKVSEAGVVVDPAFDIGLYDFGPGFGDAAVALDIDEFGQVFVTGNTNSGTFPNTANAFHRPGSSALCGRDVFVMQIDTAQNPWTAPYAGVIGGQSCDSALDIVRDSLGRIYLVGRTLSIDFPMAAQAFQSSPNLLQGVGDGFILKLDLDQAPDGQLVAGTFLGMEYFGPSNGVRDPFRPIRQPSDRRRERPRSPTRSIHD